VKGLNKSAAVLKQNRASIGRPKQRPSDPKAAMEFFSSFRNDIRQILRKCHAPSHWGDQEANVLMFFFLLYPTSAIVLRKGTDFASTQVKQKPSYAVRFAEMFVEGQGAFIEALGKIRNRLLSHKNSPEAKVRMFCGIAYAVHQSVDELFGATEASASPPILEEFWGEKAERVAGIFSEVFGKTSITPKVIEHARAKMRKLKIVSAK